MDIQAMISQVLSTQKSELIKTITDAIGLSEEKAEGLLSASVDSFGTALSLKLQSSEGMQGLMGMVMQFNPEGDSLSDLKSQGMQVITSLFGQAEVGKMTSEISAKSDIDEATISDVVPGLIAKLLATAKAALAGGGLMAALGGLESGQMDGVASALGGLLNQNGSEPTGVDLAGLAKKLF